MNISEGPCTMRLSSYPTDKLFNEICSIFTFVTIPKSTFKFRILGLLEVLSQKVVGWVEQTSRSCLSQLWLETSPWGPLCAHMDTPVPCASAIHARANNFLLSTPWVCGMHTSNTTHLQGKGPGRSLCGPGDGRFRDLGPGVCVRRRVGLGCTQVHPSGLA